MDASTTVLPPASVGSSQLTAPWMIWTGRVLTAVPILGLMLSAGMKLSHNPKIVEFWTPKLGYPETVLTPIGIVELTCALVYAIPQTSVLGAILITGYLGGAVATHVRIGEGFVPALLLAIFAWAGLFLRDRRLRALLPLRS